METKQGKAVTAYTALARMSQKTMNSFAAYKLFRLKKALAPIIEFQSEQEQKLVSEIGATITDVGAIIWDPAKEAQQRKEYAEKHRELENMTCEVETGKISMYMKEIPEITIADLDALEDFIDWKE